MTRSPPNSRFSQSFLKRTRELTGHNGKLHWHVRHWFQECGYVCCFLFGYRAQSTASSGVKVSVSFLCMKWYKNCNFCMNWYKNCVTKRMSALCCINASCIVKYYVVHYVANLCKSVDVLILCTNFMVLGYEVCDRRASFSRSSASWPIKIKLFSSRFPLSRKYLYSFRFFKRIYML